MAAPVVRTTLVTAPAVGPLLLTRKLAVAVVLTFVVERHRCRATAQHDHRRTDCDPAPGPPAHPSSGAPQTRMRST
ncbi:hypothetical protein ACFQ0M_41290 [Kitasatospora aburaviensis]